MKYRTFPGTDLSVSEVGFGTWTLALGGWGQFTDEEAISLLHRASDLGITLFDSADCYGNGRAEELVGRAFADRRERVVLATKVGYDFYSDPGTAAEQHERPQNASPAYLRRAVEGSLRRLRTDVLDLVSFHNARAEHVADDDLWETFVRLRQEGKVRHWGASLGPSNGYLYEGLDLIRHRHVTSLQLINNLLEPYPGQILTDAAEETGRTGILVRAPHASGLLEGSLTPETQFAAYDHRRERPRTWLLDGLRKLESLRFLHEGRETTLAQAALKWVLSSPAVMAALPSICNVERLEEFAAAPDAPDFTQEERQHVRALQRTNFGVDEEHPRYAGTMHRAGHAVFAPPYRYPGDEYEALEREENLSPVFSG